MGWLKNRFGEASTHAGISMICGAASLAFPQYAGLLQAAAVAFGGTAIAIPEAKR
jgi:hypothetical protein